MLAQMERAEMKEGTDLRRAAGGVIILVGAFFVHSGLK